MAKDLFNEVPREEIDTMKETLLKIKDYGTKIVTMKI